MRTECTPRNSSRPRISTVMSDSMGRGNAAHCARPQRMPAQPATLFWEDFEVGQTRAYGPLAVTREAVLDFARQFDPQPFHLDDAAAEASLFGRLAASGWHTCAMTMRMLCDAYLLDA